MVRATALILVALACSCAREDPLAKLQKSYDFAISMHDMDAKCRIASQAIDLLTERADNSLDGQIAYNEWSIRKNECAIERLG